MNNFEMASYLEMKGHKVYDNGFDIEAYLLEDYSARPINYDKLTKSAEKEGYILTDGIWRKKLSL